MRKVYLDSKRVNALPLEVRRYIAALETESDPVGTVREDFRLKAENEMLRLECLGLAKIVSFYRLANTIIFAIMLLIGVVLWLSN